MAYRKIKVDGEEYSYVVGPSFVKIVGIGLFYTHQLVNPVVRQDSSVSYEVTPCTIRKCILGKIDPIEKEKKSVKEEEEKGQILFLKGYALQVTTWENDGDNYKTEIVSGFGTKEESTHITNFLNKFKSECQGGIGNITEDYENLVEDLIRYNIDDSEIPDDWENILDAANVTNASEYYLTRVVESVKLIMFKENVIAYDV